jgi:2-oxoglutarate dehydrogenase E2 component (dihydrolipoamide succinyltransferase)
MSHEVKIPSVGESITSATLGAWLKRDGDYVEAGEAIVSFDTDKISQDLEADRSGILRHAAAEGDELEIGAVVARIEEGEAPAGAASGASSESASANGPAPEPSSPPASEGDDEASTEAVKATPVARKIAADRGLDLAAVAGSGAGGKVTKADVLGAVEDPAPEAPKEAAPAPATAPSPAGRTTRRRMSALRKKIATHLVNAQHEAAILTTFNECDMSRILAMRKQLQDSFTARHGVKLGFMSFFIKAVVDALRAVPAINARVEGDDIVENHYYDIGVAVGTDKGLFVPVVRDCESKSFAEIEQGIADYAKKAREGRITLSDLQGGVFTITNGGIYGSLLSTPILNPPQSGILGMHSIQERPVAIDGQVVIRPMMYLALSYDHRIVDGKEAVTFLVRVKDCLENPERLLVGA